LTDSVAQWICIADPLCSTALDYYNRFCRSMFAGKKCTLRCKNSISILRRQVSAKFKNNPKISN
jgi:growth arrest-specific protein 1